MAPALPEAPEPKNERSREAMIEELHIASLVVRCRPERIEELERSIAALSGAEIAASDPSGKLVVTLESASERVIAGRLEEIGVLPGVLSATLVFHHAEPAALEPEGAPS
jgi:nitrate reductase NapD